MHLAPSFSLLVWKGEYPYNLCAQKKKQPTRTEKETAGKQVTLATLEFEYHQHHLRISSPYSNVQGETVLSRDATIFRALAFHKLNGHQTEGVKAGAKVAVLAGIATAIPTLASARTLPWARANLNHAAQALIISTVAGAAYFIVADKTVLDTARRNSFKQISNIEA
ncbi:hypothetical protein NL676_035596 [Syzygium grande]|nr:hypothetical protein NL676_035596 [Syzygium grande]